MKTKKIIAIYFSGFLVGIALVLFPAAGNLFVDPDYHGFSSAQYGSIFIPQIVFSIISALSAPKIAKKVGMKSVMGYGLFSIFMAMLLLLASNWVMQGNLDYWTILLATAFLGVGFGFTITALNPFAYALFPGKETSAVTAMHIMLGLGTASAALLLNVFLNIGIWWVAPLMVGILTLATLAFTLPLPLNLHGEKRTLDIKRKKFPKRIIWYAIVVFLYGTCEATFGNFGAVFLEKEGGLSVTMAAIGLSLFWGGITVGRVLFTFIALKFSTKWLYGIAPFLVSIVFYFLPYAQSGPFLLGCMAIGGLGLSFLFPNSISVATEEFPEYAAVISGSLVAAIQLGTGFSSNVIGLLHKSHSLSSLFQYSALYALGLGGLISFLMITSTKKVE